MTFIISTVKRLKLVSMEHSRCIFIILDAKRISATQPKISLLLSGFIKTKSIGIRKILKHHEDIFFLRRAALYHTSPCCKTVMFCVSSLIHNTL
jgi:hypothetical protein